MWISTLAFSQILLATASTQLVVLPLGSTSQQPDASSQQKPLLNPGPAMPPQDKDGRDDPNQPPVQGGVVLSDVMGRDRSMNIFAGYARGIESISRRLDDSAQNSTVLAPLNSAVEDLPRKPWEEPKEYSAFGADAYEGGDGQDRAQRNLRRFVEAHVIPTSPWLEKQKVKSLLDGDREIWWEVRDGVKKIFPDDIEVSSVGSRVGNGEVWILKGVRNYA